MTNIATVSFNSGEFSPKIDARSDTEKFAAGCRRLENMIPSVFGGAERRPGTEFITSSESSDAFGVIVESIMSHENVGLCYENSVVVTDFDTLLSQISCHQNSILCYENEVVSESDNVPLISKIMCYENDVLFYENEIVINE